jgi:hypothetical protein
MSAGWAAVGSCLERNAMTRLYIDKQEVMPLPPNLTSLEQILQLVESDHLSPDVIIRDIQIDGLPLATADQEFCLPERIHDREKIEIFTSSLRDVALDSIREAIVYLERIAKATPSMASSFRLHAAQPDFENLKQFYEGFYWTNLLLDRLERSFEIPLDAVVVQGISAREHHLKLAALLKEVIEAHEKRDFGLVADLLEYEIAPLIPTCKEIFVAVRDRVLQRA